MAMPDKVAADGGVGPAAMKKSAWTKEEDAALREQVREHGPQNWAAISAALPGSNPKSCRLRWCQHLTPVVDAVRPFTPEEDEKIACLHRLYPNRGAGDDGGDPGQCSAGSTDRRRPGRWYAATALAPLWWMDRWSRGARVRWADGSWLHARVRCQPVR
ncbi:hypothetical protein C2845_PM01G08570 [Panicum miliaceum]|uniref:Uncharacterized protein n=1 Tax=Panicum miliaceum TaxID=4540 RepID=A0A3L6TP70_PANMI|nr:hypothetical protein C2845_PM01G08570 [Panicum miliaceum]